METPKDIDAMLKGILAESAEVGGPALHLSEDDQRFLDKMLKCITHDGWRGVFAIFDDDTECFKYMVLNANMRTAVALAAKVTARLAAMNKQP